jgi:hypothetical protein
LRNEKNLTAYKENTKPGSGNFFRNKSKTRLLDKVLLTDIDENKRKECINIKSLDKVKIFYNKFSLFLLLINTKCQLIMITTIIKMIY